MVLLEWSHRPDTTWRLPKQWFLMFLAWEKYQVSVERWIRWIFCLQRSNHLLQHQGIHQVLNSFTHIQLLWLPINKSFFPQWCQSSRVLKHRTRELVMIMMVTLIRISICRLSYSLQIFLHTLDATESYICLKHYVSCVYFKCGR